MKKLFKGHFRPDTEVEKEVWETGLIVFDANVLLNLYRYSSGTADEFFKVLSDNKERLWLPEQVAYEFLKNRFSVISEQVNAYKKAQESLESLQESFSGTRGHPFISDRVKRNYDKAAQSVIDELKKNMESQDALVLSDAIQLRVSEIFDGRIGDCFSDEEITKLSDEGRKRYEHKIPPGYKDGGKHSNPISVEEFRSQYGDYFLWQQLINFAREKEKSIIFVTDDRKEDWWLKQRGKLLGPLPALVEEFCSEVGTEILFYTPERFPELARKRLSIVLSKGAIEEVRSEHSARKPSVDMSYLSTPLRRIINDDRKFDSVAEMRDYFAKSFSKDIIGEGDKLSSEVSDVERQITDLNFWIKMNKFNLRALNEVFDVKKYLDGDLEQEKINLKILELEKNIERDSSKVRRLKGL